MTVNIYGETKTAGAALLFDGRRLEKAGHPCSRAAFAKIEVE